MSERRFSRSVSVGAIIIGGKAPISIQSMTNTDTGHAEATIKQINDLCAAGAELVRVAVPDEKAVLSLKEITAESPVPVVADIHYRYELAMAAMEHNIAKLRINPGNIGGIEKLLLIVSKAKEKKIALRIGVNSGSVEKKIREKYGGATSEALVESALGYIRALEKTKFGDIVISLKASDVPTTYSSYKMMADKTDYPFHIGITEAGPLYRGTVKSAVGIGALLLEGLGDTVRVSLSADPVKELEAAKLILQSAGVRRFGPELISCPTCARCGIDVLALAEEVEVLIKNIKIPLKIAVMGCAVNGPGEARDAHIGITGTKEAGLVFCDGRVLKRVTREELIPAFKEELDKLLSKKVEDALPLK